MSDIDYNQCLKYLFPNVSEYSWRLTAGKNGIYISEWKLSDRQPTMEELKAIEPLAIQAQATADATAKVEADKIAPASLEVRIKSLEERVTKLEKP